MNEKELQKFAEKAFGSRRTGEHETRFHRFFSFWKFKKIEEKKSQCILRAHSSDGVRNSEQSSGKNYRFRRQRKISHATIEECFNLLPDRYRNMSEMSSLSTIIYLRFLDLIYFKFWRKTKLNGKQSWSYKTIKSLNNI